MSEEKYISIEYGLWESKYKPMEVENNRLRDQLKENKIKVHIYLSGDGGVDRPLGYLQVMVGFPSLITDVSMISWEQKQWMETIVKDAIYDCVRKNEHGYKYYYGREEVKTETAHLKGALQELASIRLENENRIAGIPKIIKWLFKIK